MIKRLIYRIKKRRFCKLNIFFCPDCIYHDFIFEGCVFRGNRCRYPEFEHLEAKPSYDELLKAARAMHTWIFLHSGDEKMAYEMCGLSDEMNAFLGYDSGSFTIPIHDGWEE